MWLLSEVLAVELNVFQVPSAGGGVFLAMALAAGTDGLAQKCTQNILQLELGGGSRRCTLFPRTMGIVIDDLPPMHRIDQKIIHLCPLCMRHG